MRKTKSRDKQLEDARKLATEQSAVEGIVGHYDYWCRLDHGYDFPTEGMSDGTACNMHGGSLEIVEKVKDNGTRYFLVEAKRLWKTVVENDEDMDAALVRKEELDSPVEWSSPLITVHKGDPEGGDRYCYEYKVPTLSSSLTSVTVEIVGSTELKVVQTMDGSVVIFKGEFHYRQGSTGNGGRGLGAAIFRTRIASRWTPMKGMVELRRRPDRP